ncbi:hypothetical protein CERSUDRAFT_64554 [Gelatoporia subvermispora B]|uniref:Major facilitator superfamily (MFS) profile domain-containing protein n=1 Tax=Ceriporiopsis subvermispora (strain B) TaxID=914234 RepID=M2RHK0_CERS8|nr:hypothetical protein CERSUDRAFT_64554 [Gelatoporia subvermispora B]
MSKSREHSTARRFGSTSRPSSRPRVSRNASVASAPYIPQDAEGLLLPNPDAQLGEGAAELLHEFIHPHRHDSEATVTEEDGADHEGGLVPDGAQDHDPVTTTPRLPWYRRPSPWWILSFVPFSTIVLAATVAPRMEILTRIACDAIRPDYTVGRGRDNEDLFGQSHAATFGTFSDDPNWRLCASDPVVEAAVAKLQMAMTTSMGVLGCLTTAWWGSLSDRYGRTRVMSFAVIGALVADSSFLLVYHFAKYLPGGYWFLLFGPIVDGCFGGISTVSAAVHAYVADCTEPTSRSRYFSMFLGLAFIGFGIGPTFGSLFIKATGQLIVVFYIATAVHFMIACGTWFVLPESLSRERMDESRKLHGRELEADKVARANGGRLIWLKSQFGFLRPLLVLVPQVTEAQPGKRKKRDWSLVLVIGAHCSTALLMGSYTYKFQYLASTFGWTSTEIGYWISLLSVGRAVALAIVIPLVLRLFKPSAIQLPVAPNEPLDNSSSSAESTTSSSPEPEPSDVASAIQRRSTKFDLNVARVSLFIDAGSYVIMTIAPTGGIFIIGSLIASFGSGFGPAVQSLALALYTQTGGKETGRLFGAIGVIQTISSQIVGPFVFGVTFLKMVETFPKAIFVLGAATLTVAFILVSLVRLPKPATTDAEGQVLVDAAHAPEETLVDAETPLIVIEDDHNQRKIVDV